MLLNCPNLEYLQLSFDNRALQGVELISLFQHVYWKRLKSLTISSDGMLYGVQQEFFSKHSTIQDLCVQLAYGSTADYTGLRNLRSLGVYLTTPARIFSTSTLNTLSHLDILLPDFDYQISHREIKQRPIFSQVKNLRSLMLRSPDAKYEAARKIVALVPRLERLALKFGSRTTGINRTDSKVQKYQLNQSIERC
jgi:hypothetical protein